MGIKIDDKKLCTLYTKMVTELGGQYKGGTYAYIAIFYKDIEKGLNSLDARINRIWESCIKGEATLLDFLRALDSYKKYALRAFNKREKRRTK